MNNAEQAFHNTCYRVLVEKLTLRACIGILPEERTTPQPLCISLCISLCMSLSVASSQELIEQKLIEEKSFICYKELVEEITALVLRGHIGLLEDLAEMIATLCFARPQAVSVWLRLTKPDAVADAESVGIEKTFQRGRGQAKQRTREQR